MLNFAHRGFKSRYPENTMLAFKKAYEEGIDGIEFDVHLTKDNEIVIMHDENTLRTTGKDAYIKDLTFEELRELNAAYYYEGLDEKVPSLREYFEFIKDKKIITNIELKNSIFRYENIEEKVCNLIDEFEIEDYIIISSFNHQSILKVKEIKPSLKCALLTESVLIEPWNYVSKEGIEYFHPMVQTVSKEDVKKCQDNNVKVNVWFGKEAFDFKEAKDLGVDGLITDYPDLINKLK